MKHHSQDVQFPVNYSFPGDVDYIPSEGDGVKSPYFGSDVFLLRARIELEDGSEIDAPQWVLEMINLGNESSELLRRQYENWLSEEAENRSMHSAKCRLCAYERRTA